MKVKIEEIVFDKEQYPRDKVDEETVAQYRASLDNLPSILLNKKKKLVDGYHRIVAHQVEGKKEIEADFDDIPDEEILIEAIKRNSTHGKQLTLGEKKRAAIRLYKEGKKEKEIEEVLSASHGNVSDWLTKTIREEKDENREKALELYLDYISYPTQDDVAKALDTPIQTINRWLGISQNVKNDKMGNPPESLQITTAWEFKLCDPNTGMKGYPGQLAGQLIENLLWYYTEPFDIVVDPMAGGGTTVDVCKKMLRRYIAYDHNPIAEKGVKHNDIFDGIPLKDNIGDFVLLDPPYWKQKKGKYVEGEHDLASLPLDKFYKIIDDIAKESHRILKKGKKVAFIISDVSNKDVGFVDLGPECYRIFNQYFKPIEYISALWREASSHTGVWQYRAEKNKFMLRGHRHLFIMEKVK